MLIIDQTNEDYSLLTHADIEELSYSSFEKEVLFFPFSAFGVTEVTEIAVINQNRIELKLTYLGKYIKDFETKKFDPSTDSLPMNSPFLNLIKESGFVKPDVVKKIENNTFNVQEVVNEYKVYKEKNAQIQKAKEIKRKDKENKSKNTNISQEEYVPGPPPKCNPCLKKALIIGAIVLVLAIIMIVIVLILKSKGGSGENNTNDNGTASGEEEENYSFSKNNTRCNPGFYRNLITSNSYLVNQVIIHKKEKNVSNVQMDNHLILIQVNVLYVKLELFLMKPLNYVPLVKMDIFQQKVLLYAKFVQEGLLLIKINLHAIHVSPDIILHRDLQNVIDAPMVHIQIEKTQLHVTNALQILIQIIQIVYHA